LVIAFCLISVTAEITAWGTDKIPDELITEVAAGEDPIMIIFYKDTTHKSRLESKLKDKMGEKEFTLASVDMNSNKYTDLARDIRISTATDKEYPIVGMFKNGKGYVVKQYENDSNVDEIAAKFETLG
jgi:hypothetical protein